jgi:hypothetical protein
LENFFCDNNNLTYIDLSSQTSFINLYLSGNNLNSLDLSHLTYSLLELTLFGNTDLECIQVNTVNWWNANFTYSIDTIFQYFSNNCSGTSIQEQTKVKELLKKTDLLGRETKEIYQPLFYIYDDGTVEKKIVIE